VHEPVPGVRSSAPPSAAIKRGSTSRVWTRYSSDARTPWGPSLGRSRASPRWLGREDRAADRRSVYGFPVTRSTPTAATAVRR